MKKDRIPAWRPHYNIDTSKPGERMSEPALKQLRIHKDKRLAVLPFDEEVYGLIHSAKLFDASDGARYLLVPADPDELKILRNIGYSPPSMWDYDWRGLTPFDSQRVTAQLMVDKLRAYILNDMGTGKTLSSLFAFDYLRAKGLARKMLVVAPLSTLTTVWEGEVFRWMPHLHVQSLWHPVAAKRKAALHVEADIYVINHDGVQPVFHELMARRDIDCVLIDELAVLRNKQTRRWKLLKAVTERRKYVWGMTGSPTPKEPSDAWAQIKLITPENTTKYYKQFREMTMVQISQFVWLPKQEASDIVFSQMQPAVRFTRDECIDLPPTTYSTRHTPLEPVSKKAYDAMMKQYAVEFAAGTVVAANAGVRTSKLLQIACGFVYGENGSVHHIEAAARMRELMGIIDGSRNKIIVFAPFTEAVDSLYSELRINKYDVAKIYGATPKKERDSIFYDFQHTDNIRVLLCHPQTTAHGLTLTAADTVVWFSPTPSLEIYEQANARITRPGQENHTHIIHIEGCGIEQKIYNKLAKRADAQNILLELFKDDH